VQGDRSAVPVKGWVVEGLVQDDRSAVPVRSMPVPITQRKAG
jgi:hypothetical protein